MRRVPALFLGAAVLATATAATGVTPVSAAEAHGYTCSGGTIAPGTYESITVSGFCAIPSGAVHVENNLRLLPNSGLNATFDTGTLTVGADVLVGRNAVLGMGCSKIDNPPGACNPPHDRIGGNLDADNARGVLVYTTHVHGKISIRGGSGAVGCSQTLFPHGPPVYSTLEDNFIEGSTTVIGYTGCWFGFIRNHVDATVRYDRNMLADPDASEIVTNVIGESLVCHNNSPAPHVGDSGGVPNKVEDSKVGQCDAPGL